MAGTLEINARIMTPIVLFHRPAMQGNGHVPGPPDRPIPRPEYARTDASSASRLPSPRCLNPRSPFPAHFFPSLSSFPPPRPTTFEDRRRFPRVAASIHARQIFRRIEVSREIMEIAVIPGNQRRRRVAQTFPYAFNNAEARARKHPDSAPLLPPTKICVHEARPASLPRPDFALNWQ